MDRTDRDDIDDIDLLAHADGRLTGDPTRLRQVEAWLATHPEAAFKVGAYRDQNAALRRAYDRRLSDSVPDRLYRAIENTPPRLAPRLARFGAVAALMTVATGLGWMAGQRGSPPDWSMDEFLQQSYSQYRDARLEGVAASDSSYRATADERRTFLPTDWVGDGLSLALLVPNLDDLGYAMTDKRTVEAGSEPLVRITYEGRQGSRFHLFLRPRWDAEATDVQLMRRDDLSLAYWLEGPLASAIVANVPPEEALAIANAVRQAMSNRPTAPAVRPAHPTHPTAAMHKNSADGTVERALLPETIPGELVPLAPLPTGDRADSN